MQWSTVSTAVMAAFREPVWPTMSALAKLTMIRPYFLESMACLTDSHTSRALIWGAWS